MTYIRNLRGNNVLYNIYYCIYYSHIVHIYYCCNKAKATNVFQAALLTKILSHKLHDCIVIANDLLAFYLCRPVSVSVGVGVTPITNGPSAQFFVGWHVVVPKVIGF